jgi:hypothetical protein
MNDACGTQLLLTPGVDAARSLLATSLALVRLVVGVVLAGATVACLAGVDAVTAIAAGRNGAIAYEGRASAEGYLYLRKADGSRPIRLRTTGRPSAPSVSPFGRRIAFSSGAQIWTVYVDGTALRQVTSGPLPARTPAWSPAADSLAFAGGPQAAQDIYVIGADGGDLRRLTLRNADEESPAWSSRDRIAFVRRSPRGDGDIFSISPRGGSSKRLTRGRADDADPAWSPDGRFVAFTRGRGGVRDVYVIGGGKQPRRLTRLRHSATSPAWAPNGRSIAFAVRGSQGSRFLYVMRRDGRRLRRVGSSTSDPRSLDWQATGFDPIVAAAGDIACDPASRFFSGGVGQGNRCQQLATSNLLLKTDLSAVLALGDIQYEDGRLAKFTQAFDPTWGRVKPLIRPVLGNHDYRIPNAGGYFDYFNGVGRTVGQAGERGAGYYSFDVGRWHIVALNSQCSEATPTDGAPSCAAGSTQEQWLRADLAAHRRPCTLAFWHHPLLSSGITRLNAAVAPLWQALVDYRVDVALVGHDHAYERFAPIDATGAADSKHGVRQFVVGTGGKSLTGSAWHAPNSELRQNDTQGILELTLQDRSYSWSYLSAGTRRFRDTGSRDCH